MSDNVGLTTPRGSGTSGYVQRNLSNLKPRDKYKPYSRDRDAMSHRQRKPDQQILDHDRLREIEVKVFELRDQLEDEGVEEEEIETQTQALREKLLSADKTGKGSGARPGHASGGDTGRSPGKGSKKQFKTHQVHEQAEAKIAESERLRRALGISKDYEEGGHWKRQEQRLKASLPQDQDR